MQCAKGTILLVDDETSSSRELAASLAEDGFRVRCATSVAQARSMLECGPIPDILIVDQALESHQGLTLAEHLQAAHSVPFVVISRDACECCVERAVNSGAFSYLIKPVTFVQFLPVLRAAIARGRESGQLREQNRRIEDALKSDRAVSVAIGMLMVHEALDEGAAFERLRSEARAMQRKLPEHAQSTITRLTRSHPEPSRGS